MSTETVAAFTGSLPTDTDYVAYANISREPGTGRVRITVRGHQKQRGENPPEAHLWMTAEEFRGFAVDICANELSD